MEPKNCVAFRVDKVGSQEPALDLYCSKNKLIRGQQHPPYLLARTFLDLRNDVYCYQEAHFYQVVLAMVNADKPDGGYILLARMMACGNGG